MATKYYKQTFKSRSLADVESDIGKRGGLIVRIDQQADQIIGYYAADDAAPAGAAAGDATEVKLDEVTKVR